MEYDEVIRVGSRVAYNTFNPLGKKEGHGEVISFGPGTIFIKPDTYRGDGITRETQHVRKLRIEELI